MAKMFDPPHPGGILKEELDCLKISVSDFAKQIVVDPAYLKLVLQERAPITTEIAHKIALVITGPKAEVWIAIQKDFDESLQHCPKGFICS